MTRISRRVLIGLIAGFFGIAGPVLAALTTPELYKEALLQETTVRDLEAATRLFEDYLKRPDAEAHLKASALLRVGDCYEKLGKTDLAKKAWIRIPQEYPQEGDFAQEAKNRLLSLEAQAAPQVIMSTPVVQVVYKTPRTRFAFEWLDLTFYQPLDGKEPLLDEYFGNSYVTLPHSLVYFVKPYLAFGMEGRRLFNAEYSESTYTYSPGSSSYSELNLSYSLAYIAPIAHVEKRTPLGIAPYANLGPAAYRFHFEGNGGSSTPWSPGLTSEFGLTLGGSRGFTLSLSYSILGFVQKAPSSELIGGTFTGSGFGLTENVTEAHGWRWLGGPAIKLGFRW